MFWAIQKPKNYCSTKSEQWQTADGPNKSHRRCHHDGGRPSARWIGISETVADRSGRTKTNNDCKSEYVSDIKKPISTNCTYKSILFCFYARTGEINVCANFNIALPASTSPRNVRLQSHAITVRHSSFPCPFLRINPFKPSGNCLYQPL